ncbi:hypothetical protein AX16_006446 [Volvariella volvacea WC 439]|nr:hypothetical protein AX16_006446 [Volvariella volvacea WC 439]
MDFLPKTFTTSRALVYSYIYVPPEDATLPVLLFLHGFPTTSSIWRHQLAFFRDRGFGLLAPDMLGFGKTAKPTDPEQYRPSLVCNDIIELLDVESVGTAVVIGHDFGCKIASRLANLHGERFEGFAFLAVPYCAPRPRSDMHYTATATKKMCGYELCGHTLFFAEDDAARLLKEHVDSFHSAIFPEDPKMWVTEVAPIGALRKWLEADKKANIASYLSATAQVDGINADDDKSIPVEKYVIVKPVFFGAARHDYISRSVLGIATTNHHCPNARIQEFDAGHWLMLSCPSKVNYALNDWIMDIV